MLDYEQIAHCATIHTELLMSLLCAEHVRTFAYTYCLCKIHLVFFSSYTITCMYMYVCTMYVVVHVHRHHGAHIGVFSGMYFSCGNTLIHMYSSSSSIRMCVLVYDSLSVMLREGE